MKSLYQSWLISISLLTISPYASAQEYFGDFLDRLRGVFVRAEPRPLFKLETDFRFKDPNGLLWTTPTGTEVDGASIPQFFWSLIGGPFEGPYINASVIHDHYCRTKERTAHDTHRNFYYGMRAAEVPEWKASLMHWAVSTFGPAWKVEKRVVMSQICTPHTVVGTTCTSVPTTVDTVVTIPPPDLSDPTVLAAAISKTNAIARTLLTSNGEYLDVTNKGAIKATVDNIQSSATAYREVFMSKDFTSTSTKLGLLSQSTGSKLSDVKPWNGNRLPKFSEAVVLTPQTVRMVDESKPFTVDQRSKNLLQDRIDIRALETTTNIQIRDK